MTSSVKHPRIQCCATWKPTCWSLWMSPSTWPDKYEKTVFYKLYVISRVVGMKTIQLMKKQTKDEVASNLTLSSLSVKVAH